MAHIRENKEKCTLMVDLDVSPDIREKIATYAQINNFILKQEFHLTLIGFALGAEIQKINSRVYEQIVTLAKEFTWEFEPTDKYYHIKKHYTFSGGRTEDRESIIVIILPKDLEYFWTKVCAFIGKNIPIPFPHITLASKSSNPENQMNGIGIQTFEDFEHLHYEKIQI